MDMLLKGAVKKAYGKLRSCKGFSLAELLLATIIMLLATSVLTGTISLALSNYRKASQASNAQLLCSTLSVYVQNELSYASVTLDKDGNIKTGNGGAVQFTSGAHNFGPDAYFGIKTATSEDPYPVTADSAQEGRIVEVSNIYQNNFGDKKSFDIAGKGSYMENAPQSGLKAGMTLSFEDDSFIAHIIVKPENGDNVLAEKYLRIIPLEIKE
jgi:type II secretory pathway pseudopilin PulG